MARVLTQLKDFNHSRPEHKQQDCTACHQRSGNDPTPVFPTHPACIACHASDFTSTTSQLCVGCHASVQPPIKFIGFPKQMKEFGLHNFSHRTHMDAAKRPIGTTVARCDTCHSFDQQKIGLSFPRHPECYSCHTHQAGQRFGDCGSCHTFAAASMKYLPGLGLPTSLYNFKHATHLKEAKIQGRCDKCHPATSGLVQKALPDIVQIKAAPGQRHKSGCFTCHVNAKEPNCSKCHVSGLTF